MASCSLYQGQMRCRGGFGGFGGPRAGCVRQFRSGTIGAAAERLQGCQTAPYISRPDALPQSDAERLERSVGPGWGVSGSFGAVQHRGAAAERLQGRGATIEAFAGMASCSLYIKARRAAAESLEGSVGPGRGVSGSFGAVQYRGAAAERLQGWQAAAHIKARRAAAERCGAFGAFGGPSGTKEVLLRSVWGVRWTQGGVCPAASERYNRGGAAERQGWQVECYEAMEAIGA